MKPPKNPTPPLVDNLPDPSPIPGESLSFDTPLAAVDPETVGERVAEVMQRLLGYILDGDPKKPRYTAKVHKKLVSLAYILRLHGYDQSTFPRMLKDRGLTGIIHTDSLRKYTREIKKVVYNEQAKDTPPIKESF